MSEKGWNIAVVGATGAAGEQIVECLEERDFPVRSLRFLEVAPDPETVPEFRGMAVVVEELGRDSFAGTDIVFFAGDADSSRELCPAAQRAGAVCIDTSGAWVLDPRVPLVLPEINPQEIARFVDRGIIALPSSGAIPLLSALKPLHDFGTIRRVVVSTYQGVSTAGKEAMQELHNQVLELLNARTPDSSVFPHRVAFNCLPQVGSFADNGTTDGESSLADETRRFLEDGEMGISVTAVRVPVFYGDAASVNVETEERIDAEQARELIARTAGCQLVDDPSSALYPMALDAAGQDLVLVGRVRQDDSQDNCLNLWVVADALRQSAVGAVRVAELLVEKYLR